MTRLATVAAAAVLSAALVSSLFARAAVPQGTEERAKEYYRDLSDTLKFRTRQSILKATLDDFLEYIGYGGLKAIDVLRLDSDVLMDPERLGTPCAATPCGTAVSNPAAFRKAFGSPGRRLKDGDILAARFFAPKIINVNEPADSLKLGWRKLVRFRSRPGSEALKRDVDSSIVLFNFFTDPGKPPFGEKAASVNTQVMLLTKKDRFESEAADRDSIYWLDFDDKSVLSLKLDATFDAADLQAAQTKGVLPYFVPDGCVACHGENNAKALVNYLDTDHWFDRVATDFQRLIAEKGAVLFDAGTNDTSSPAFRKAFDVIRRFNQEAAAQVAMAQPRAFHRRASDTWLRLHRDSDAHVLPLQRAIKRSEMWQPGDRALLEDLNQYCFRCHGTIKFNVFEKAEVHGRSGLVFRRLKPDAEDLEDDPHFLMPPDRTLEPGVVERIRAAVVKLEGPQK